MAPITSLSDFFRKAETDERYRRLAMIAYNDLYHCNPTFEEAKEWINDWTYSNVECYIYTLDNVTCEPMVRFLNSCIPLIENQ